MGSMSSMGGMEMRGAASGGPLPAWLAVAWAATFAVLLAWHAVHARRTCGRSRTWHAGHAAMAAAMVVMYAPLTAGAAVLADVAWPLPVAVAALLLAVGLGGQAGPRPARIGLWLLAAVDVAAMGAMWAPAATGVTVGSLLAATMAAAMVTMAWLLPRVQGGRERVASDGPRLELAAR